MELACAIVLTFVTVVSGVPHGYGAVGGAGAATNAQASSVAGAFSGLGGLPLSIPSGAGFSGSFSKSSSSSFASSSASSGSYSFSGSGVAGLNGVGANNFGTSGNGDCTSGFCNGIGSKNFSNGGCATGECKDSSGKINNSPNLFNGANSAAVAQAGAAAQSGVISGYPNFSHSENQPCIGDCGNVKPIGCKGTGCNNFSDSSTNCASGQCAEHSSSDSASYNNEPKYVENTQTGIPSTQIGFSDNKCSSGKCDTKTQTTSSLNKPASETESSKNQGSNHIPVRVTGPSLSNSGDETSYQSSIYGNTAGSTVFSNTKSVSNTNPSISSQNSYNKPSTDLLTPKEGQACTSTNCQHTQGNKPGQTYLTPSKSDNNVPANDAYLNLDLGASKTGCSSGNCFNVQPNIPTTYQTGPLSCNSGNCGDYSSGQQTGFNYSKDKTPNHNLNVNQGITSSILTDSKNPSIPNTSTYFQSSSESCVSGNCGERPLQKIPESSTSVSNIGNNFPSIQVTGSASDLKNPTYNQNTTPKGPVNCGSGNCNSNLSPKPSGYAISGSKYPSNPQGLYPNGVMNCGSGKCANFPSVSTIEFDATGSNIPSYFQDRPPTNQQNCVSGKCNNVPFVKPTEQNSQKISPNGPVNCQSGNCNAYPSTQPSKHNASGYKYPNNPQGNPNNPVNCVSGNCVSTVTTQTTTFNNIGGNTGVSQNCASGKCGSYPTPMTIAISTLGSEYPHDYHSISPITPTNCAPGKCDNIPSDQYVNTAHNNIGGNTGVSQSCATGKCGNYPIPITIAVNTLESKYPNDHHSISHITPTNCASGKCDKIPFDQYANTEHKVPNLDGSLPNNKPNCATENCNVPNNSQEPLPEFVPLKPARPIYNTGLVQAKPDNLDIKPTNIPLHTLNINNAASINSGTSYYSSSTSNLNENVSNSLKGPVYTGGFGGPPGILNPNNFDLPPPGGFVPTKDNKLEASKTGNSEINKPACSSGVCGTSFNQAGSKHNNNHANISPESTILVHSPHISSDQSQISTGVNAVATASSNAVAYSGGFGGPPGFLKPYDHGKIENSGAAIDAGKYSGASAQIGANYESGNKAPHLSYENKINGNTGSQGFIAQAGSFSGAAAGAFGNGHYGGQNKGNNGCSGGCGSTGSDAYNSNLNFGLGGGFGLSKIGILDGIHSGFNTAGAAVKSLAGALSGANAGSVGFGASFASSAASTSSGTATKGGYGR